MGLGELYKLIMIGSLMDNLRMENSMGTEDGLIMMVNTMNKNVKMVIGLEIYRIWRRWNMSEFLKYLGCE